MLPTAQEFEVQQGARKLAQASIAPRAREFEQAEAVDAEVFVSLAERGLMGVQQSKAHGGSAQSAGAYCLAMIEVGRACASTAVTMAVTNMVGEILERYARPSVAAEYVPRLCKGELGAFALSEAEAGSDPKSMKTRARLEKGHWILDGGKQWISHGDGASLLIVWANTDKGITAFAVDGDAEGLEVVRSEVKMGLLASHTAQLSLDGVCISEDRVVGEVGRGMRIALAALDGGRLGVASQAIGIAEAAWEEFQLYAKDHALSPEQQRQLVDDRVALDAATRLVLHAAALKTAGEPFSDAAAKGKLLAAESAWQICNHALDAVGMPALEYDHPLQRYFRDVRVCRIYEGTSEIQRLVIQRSFS